MNFSFVHNNPGWLFVPSWYSLNHIFFSIAATVSGMMNDPKETTPADGMPILCFFGGLVWTEQLWGPCLRLEHGVVIRTSSYSIDVQSLLSGVNSPGFPACLMWVLRWPKAGGDIWDDEGDNFIEIFKVLQSNSDQKVWISRRFSCPCD